MQVVELMNKVSISQLQQVQKYLRLLTDEAFIAACRDSPGEKWRFAICDALDGQQVAIATSIAAACHSAKKAGIHMYLCH